MKILKLLTLILLAMSLLIITSCSKNKPAEKGSPEYIKQIQDWHQHRMENLEKENGWLNLVGLYWLHDGENTFGSDSSSDIVFPKKAPGRIGTFTVANGKASVKINPDISVTVNKIPIKSMELTDDYYGNPTVMQLGTYRWFVINRNGRLGIRLRDLNAPLLKTFKGTETYPINEDWRVTAKFHPFSETKVIEIPNIIKSVEKDTVTGELSFRLKDKNFTLLPVKEGNEFFIIFADKTNGDETYGAGRFIYTSLPNSNGNVIIDFNKAYNPPCAFTRFATCPLPPKENYLDIKITAGEKKYGEEP